MMLTPNGRKKAVITGATSGLGAAYAQGFAEMGYDLIITGRRRNIIESVACEIKKKFGVRVNIAITELSKCLHCELRAHGIKIQCVLPGFTRTDLGRGIDVDMNIIEDKPTRKWMRPEEVVNASLRELKKKNSVVCIPGVGNKIAYVEAKIMPERLWYMMEPGIVRNMP